MNHREILQALLDGETLVRGKTTVNLINDCLVYDLGTTEQVPVHNLCVDIPSLWKIKPKTININGFEVPEPLRTKLNYAQTYYIVDLSTSRVVETDHWDDTSMDNRRLEAGLIHLTKEAAEKHREALLSFTKVKKDDN